MSPEERLIEEMVKTAERSFGFHRVASKQDRRKPNGGTDENYSTTWDDDLDFLIDHDNDVALAMKLLVAGMHDGAVVNLTRALIRKLANGEPDRIQRRLDEVSRSVNSARAKIGQQTAETAKGSPYPFITADTPLDISRKWVIKGVMALEEISSFIGAPGGAKSALLTDIAIHTAIRPEWRSYKIREPRAVVYWALERGFLVRRRIEAYRRRDEIAGSIPIAIIPHIINLLDKQCAVDIVETIKAVQDHFGMAVGLVVFDTYSKGISAGGGDEDKAKDQNIVNANMRRVLEMIPIHISGIGHTGKDESRGERGSNAHLADVDMQAVVNGNDTIRTATVTKANDQDTGPLTSYSLERIELGLDPEDGDVISTFIVDDTPLPDFAAAKKGRPPKQALVAFNMLQKCITESGTSEYIRGGATKMVATVDMWKRYFQTSSVVATEDKKSFDTAFRRAADRLQADGFIEVWGGKVWIVRE